MHNLKKVTAIVMSVVMLVMPVLAAASQASGWTTSGTRSLNSRPDIPVSTPTRQWQDYDPAPLYPNTVRLPKQIITLADGTRLAAYITLPADSAGNPVTTALPTVLVISDYNVQLGERLGPPLGIFLGAADPYIVKRGYASISVDGRGTGSSEGTWDAWGSTQGDYEQIIDWVVQQPWSNGSLALRGVSDLGIHALFAAETGHPAIKAVYAGVPLADGYRDTVFTGGTGNILFLSLWFSITTLLSALNLELLSDPDLALPIVQDHLRDALLEFQVPLFVRGVLGDPEVVFDGPFWRSRSPLERVSDIQVPTFLVGAVHDIFQRGTPLLYEQLKNRVDTRLVILPDTHVEAAFVTAGLLPTGKNLGFPDFNHLELQWYDQYLKGQDSGADRQPRVTQYMIGIDQLAVTSDWPAPEAKAKRYYLHSNGSLKTKRQPFFGMPRTLLDIWFAGGCSISTSQWSLGLLGLIPLPCFETDNAAKLFNLLYETPAFESDFAINGPIQADIWVSTTGIEGTLSVRVDDVDPLGNATPISNGLMALKARRVDNARSRTLDGQSIQPWHPFTKAAQKPVFPGMIMKVPVEVFSTSAVIKAGHKLRIAVGPSNLPQGLQTGLDGLLQLAPGLMTVYSDYWHPSSVVIPRVPVSSFTPVPKP